MKKTITLLALWLMPIALLTAQQLLNFSKNYEVKNGPAVEAFTRASDWFYQKHPDSSQAIVGGNQQTGWRLEAYIGKPYKGSTDARYDGSVDFKVVITVAGATVRAELTDFNHNSPNGTMGNVTSSKKAPFTNDAGSKKNNQEWANLKDQVCTIAEVFLNELGAALK